MKFGLLLFILHWWLFTFAQQLNVQILVKDQKKELLYGAHVQLTSINTGKTLNGITNEQGKAVIENVNEDLYRLKISYVGYKTLETTVKVNAQARYFEYKLQSDAISLNEVTVSAPKPIIKQEEDKTIIDPEPVANTSTNTMEVIESTPGLYVDQDGGVFISGTTPAAIYINGREQKLSSQDIATILRSLPPNSVERIEVMRAPSTKYDAATSGGIINIILKKGVRIGRFGSFNIGANQGNMGNRFAGFTFNNSLDKTNLYLNFNYNYDGRLDELNINRVLKNDTLLSQSTLTKNAAHQFYLGYGVNYETADSLSFSYDGRINAGLRNLIAENKNSIENQYDFLLSDSRNNTETESSFFNLQQDFGMIKKYDTLGSQWENKLSYSLNLSPAQQNFYIHYFYPLVFDGEGRANNTQNRHFIVAQSDLTYTLPFKIKMETGLKGSFQNLTSQSNYFNLTNGEEIKDTIRTKAFIYNELINAAYLQGSKTLWAGIILKAGIRAEHTYMHGKQTIPTDTSFTQNRIDFFPYIYLSRRIIKMMGIELFSYVIYRKTITRPNYQDLSPAIRYIDEFTYETGNPLLKPQYTDNIEWNISYNDMPIFAFGKNYTRNIFSSVVYQDTAHPQIVIRTLDNLGSNEQTYFRGMAGIPPGGVYFFGIGAQYNYDVYDGSYQNQPFHYQRGSWRFFTFHQLKLTKETKLTVSGFMMTSGMWNFYELKNFGQINIGLSQNFFNRKLTVTINMRDVLHTNVNKFTFNVGGIYSYGDRYTDNQRIGINIRYNFGIKTKEERKAMLKMNEEESSEN
ncbi:MAG: outer membrane beta-barrel protein [Bacteroidales bacterium]|nr:outer membrane beta-barrel protein [Bacteroidales bacterium]